MDTPPTPYKDELASALDWWRDAGVDYEFTDDATAWLDAEALKPSGTTEKTAHAAPEKPAPIQTDLQPPKIQRADLLGPSPPATLQAFHEFWMEAPGLDDIGPRGRVPPRGVQNAKLMVLVTDPEPNDRDRLLSGEQGELLNTILRAMGLTDSEIYIASALPRHTPMADTHGIAERGMDAVTLKHIALVQPNAVLAMGSNISPLIKGISTKEPQSLREINLSPSPIPAMLTEGLDSLMAMPRLKERFWRRWIEWSSDKF